MLTFRAKDKQSMTEAQRTMYASEKEENFRWISALLATRSPHTLTDDDLVDTQLTRELEELGQFAELAHSTFGKTRLIFNHLPLLIQPNYPLQGYAAVLGSELVSEHIGDLAALHTYVAFRPSHGQLIIATSGTSSSQQALQDMRVHTTAHPSCSKARVHVGFWSLYQGVKKQTFEGIAEGVKLHRESIREVVFTGHSMGGALSYLFMLDALEDPRLVGGFPMILAAFGAPRVGNRGLAEYWREKVHDHRAQHGQDSVKEYSVKGFNDGVPTLPPRRLGYFHCTKNPMYFMHGRLYRVPSSENEHSLFTVEPSDAVERVHPLGGHNYYSGRDMEKTQRLIQLARRAIEESGNDPDAWKARYEEIVQS